MEGSSVEVICPHSGEVFPVFYEKVGDQITFPVDLSPIGMPGCKLQADVLVRMPLRLERWRRNQGGYAYLQLPNDAGLTGARLRLQSRNA